MSTALILSTDIKVIFFFTAEGRVDLRELVKRTWRMHSPRIELRQIGSRDQAKLVGGIGICGRELCCCTFLDHFAPVNLKLARSQGLSLNPGKLNECLRQTYVLSAI